jgi:cytoskeletal protein CcmA (bactofilin family)
MDTTMAVFRQKTEETGMAKHSSGSTAEHINMIGEGTVLEGTLTSPGDIHVRGRVIGKIQAEGRIVLAQEGVVEGELLASNADIAGRVEGDVRIETRLILKGTARIEGNVYTNRLVMEEGALYNGQCEMGRSGMNQIPSMADREDEVE